MTEKSEPKQPHESSTALAVRIAFGAAFALGSFAFYKYGASLPMSGYFFAVAVFIWTYKSWEPVARNIPFYFSRRYAAHLDSETLLQSLRNPILRLESRWQKLCPGAWQVDVVCRSRPIAMIRPASTTLHRIRGQEYNLVLTWNAPDPSARGGHEYRSLKLLSIRRVIGMDVNMTTWYVFVGESWVSHANFPDMVKRVTGLLDALLVENTTSSVVSISRQGS